MRLMSQLFFPGPAGLFAGHSMEWTCDHDSLEDDLVTAVIFDSNFNTLMFKPLLNFLQGIK